MIKKYIHRSFISSHNHTYSNGIKFHRETFNGFTDKNKIFLYIVRALDNSNYIFFNQSFSNQVSNYEYTNGIVYLDIRLESTLYRYNVIVFEVY